MPTGECAYCGTVGECTDDHIPPKTLFAGTLSAPLRTVRACAHCNGGSSLDDEYFRDTVLKYHRVADQPMAQPLVEKMLRAAAMPAKAKYTERTLAAMRDVTLVTSSGLYVPGQVVLQVDGQRLSRAVSRYVRGLHRYHFLERVPADTPISATVNPDYLHEHIDSFFAAFAGSSVTTVQQGVFWYAWLRPQEAPFSSYWLLVFFDAFPIAAAIRPDSALPECGAG